MQHDDNPRNSLLGRRNLKRGLELHTTGLGSAPAQAECSFSCHSATLNDLSAPDLISGLPHDSELVLSLVPRSWTRVSSCRIITWAREPPILHRETCHAQPVCESINSTLTQLRTRGLRVEFGRSPQLCFKTTTSYQFLSSGVEPLGSPAQLRQDSRALRTLVSRPLDPYLQGVSGGVPQGCDAPIDGLC